MRWTSQMCGYILYGCAILPVLNVLMTHLWFLFAILASDWTLNTFWVGICSLPLTVFHIIWALGFASMKRSATKRVRVKVRRTVRIKRKDEQHSARPTPKLALPAPPPPPQLSASGQSQPHKRRLPPPPPPSPPQRPAHTSLPMLLRYPLPLPPPPPPPPLQTSNKNEKSTKFLPLTKVQMTEALSGKVQIIISVHVRICPKAIPRCHLRCSKVF